METWIFTIYAKQQICRKWEQNRLFISLGKKSQSAHNKSTALLIATWNPFVFSQYTVHMQYLYTEWAEKYKLWCKQLKFDSYSLFSHLTGNLMQGELWDSVISVYIIDFLSWAEFVLIWFILASQKVFWFCSVNSIEDSGKWRSLITIVSAILYNHLTQSSYIKKCLLYHN